MKKPPNVGNFRFFDIFYLDLKPFPSIFSNERGGYRPVKADKGAKGGVGVQNDFLSESANIFHACGAIYFSG